MLSSKMELKKLILILLHTILTVASVEIPEVRKLEIEEPKKSLNVTESPTQLINEIINSTTKSPTTIKTDNDKPAKSIVTTKTELEKMKAVIMRGKSKNLSRAEIEKAVRKVIGVKGLDEDKKEKHINNVLELMMQSISSQMVKYQKI